MLSAIQNRPCASIRAPWGRFSWVLRGLLLICFPAFGNAGDKVDLAGFWRVEPNAMIHVVSDDEISCIIEAEMLLSVDQGILGRAAIAGITLFARFRNDRVNVAHCIDFANRVSVSRCDVNNPIRSVAGGARRNKRLRRGWLTIFGHAFFAVARDGPYRSQFEVDFANPKFPRSAMSSFSPTESSVTV